MRPPATITVRDATLHYAETDAPAVLDATLTVHRGQTIALVGENGSGKTSLARLIAGLYHPDSGTVSWDGTPLSTVEPETCGSMWRWSARSTGTGRSPPNATSCSARTRGTGRAD